ncbi:MAG: IS66 family transposase [Clostridium sp.]
MYCRNQRLERAYLTVLIKEKYLRAFLDNRDIPIDNSACERAIRPFCGRKKNWNVIDTVEWSPGKCNCIQHCRNCQGE